MGEEREGLEIVVEMLEVVGRGNRGEEIHVDSEAGDFAPGARRVGE